MKLRIPSIARLSFPLASALALMLGSTAQAVNYSYGTLSPAPFTITASDQWRAFGAGGTTFYDASGDIYWRVDDPDVFPDSSDKAYIHFDLSSLAGAPIVGAVSLNQVVADAYGAQITAGQISTADTAWTGGNGNPAPTFTAIPGSTAPADGAYPNLTASWTIPDAAFQGFVDNSPSTFHGLVLTGGNGSTAHFSGTPTLTGTADTGEIVVSNAIANAWDLASFNSGTSTLTVSGSDNVSSGNVMLKSGATLSVVGAATLGSGNFGGSFANDGTLSFGSSVNQTLGGVVSGSGELVKSGTGTLTLSAANSYSGPTTIHDGALVIPGSLGNTTITVNAPGTLIGQGENSLEHPITLNVASISFLHGHVGVGPLTMNGGLMTTRDGAYYGWESVFLTGDVVVGGSSASSILAGGSSNNRIHLAGHASGGTVIRTFDVADATSDGNADLIVSAALINGRGDLATAGLTKAGVGMMTLSGANDYSGLTFLNEGVLRIANSTGLGAGGFNGGTMTYIANDAALELQGDLAITEHFHMRGAGPAGQGVLRSLSGNSSLSTNFALVADSTFGVDSGNLTISATIYQDGGSYGLTKTGSGTLTLSGSNGYTGPTVVNAGTLKLSAPTLTDNFNATGVNDNLSTRQTGGAATQSWTPTGNVQVGNSTPVQQPPGTNGDYLLLAFGGEAKLAGMPLSNANVAGPLKISFDMFKGNTGNASEWTSFRLSPGGSGFPVAGSGEFGFLYRQTTGMQIFNNGGAIENFGSTAGGDSFSLYLTDSAGTGSPFAGNGTKVTLTQGVGVLGDYTLDTGMGTSLIAFGSAGSMIGGVDNLAVSFFKTNVLNPAAPVSLTASGAVLELDNMYQTVASLSGVSGSAVNLGPLSRLTVNGADITSFHGVIAGTSGSLTKDGPGALTLTGTNTYTGDTTVNQGTLAVNGSSIANTNKLVINGGNVDLTGAETVKTLFFGAVQQAPGTYPANGNQLTGSGTLIVTDGPTGYASWMAPFITGGLTGDTTPGGDPENDGMKNLLEYALNGNPSISDPSIQPDLVVTATDFEFTYSRLDLSLADTTQTFEYGSDLSGWTPVLIPAGPGVSTVGAATITITDTGATDSVQISIPKSVSPSGKLFGRLNVVK